MFVDEAIGVEDVERGGDACGELAGVRHGETLVGDDLGEVGIDRFHDGVDDGGVIEHELAELFEPEDVRMAESLDTAPAGEDFFLVEVAGDEPDDGWISLGVGRGEEGAATFREEEFFQREGAVNGTAFVFGPEFHRGLPVQGIGSRQKARWANRTESVGRSADATNCFSLSSIELVMRGGVIYFELGEGVCIWIRRGGMSGAGLRGLFGWEQQIGFGNGRQKGKGNRRSFAAIGVTVSFFEELQRGEARQQQILRFAKDDSKKCKGKFEDKFKGRDKGRGKGNRRSFAALRMTTPVFGHSLRSG